MTMTTDSIRATLINHVENSIDAMNIAQVNSFDDDMPLSELSRLAMDLGFCPTELAAMFDQTDRQPINQQTADTKEAARQQQRDAVKEAARVQSHEEDNENVVSEKLLEYYASLDGRSEQSAAEEELRDHQRAENREMHRCSDRIQEAYEQAILMSRPPVEKALGVLASFYYHPEAALASDTGDTFNATQFQQRGMLGNLCQNAQWQHENAKKHVRDLWTKYDQVSATSTGSDIDVRKMHITMDQIERAQNVQVPACREWLKMCMAAYYAIVGEKWKPYAKKGKDAKEQTLDSVRTREEQLRRQSA